MNANTCLPFLSVGLLDSRRNENQRQGSARLSLVVDAYEHALLGRYPRTRYLVGINAKYIFAPLQAMPEWFSDSVLRKFDSDQRLLASIKR